jgi:alanine racemase
MRSFTQQQLGDFRSISEKLSQQLGYQPIRHTLNTSGIINYPEHQYEMVRTGIGLYGFGNTPEETAKLRPVATLKTVISQLHTIEAGHSVGYNRAFVASNRMRTATLPIGHTDGISRAYGKGKGWVSVHGKKAPIVGNVCMDMIMVDVTDIDCDEGDEVVVFGNYPTAEALARTINSIPYELLTAISQRVKRVVCRK